MLLVRQPIPRGVRIALGVLSVAILVGWYTYLSNARQRYFREVESARLPPVMGKLEVLDAQIQAIREEPSGAEPDGEVQGELEALQEQRERIQQQLNAIERDIERARDPTMPTWRELYERGLLKVVTAQGLSKDEYWLWEDATATAWRLIAGLTVGVALSVALGILMGAYSPIEAFFIPPLSFLAKIPPTAMLVVFFVLVGTTFKMYVTMIAFGTLPTLAQTIFQSARSDVPKNLINKAYTLGASHTELIWNVIYKQILPRTIDAARLQIGPAMVLLVAAEWMVASEGFGYRLRLSYQLVDMSVVFVYLFLLGMAGLTADYALTWFRRWICPWFEE